MSPEIHFDQAKLIGEFSLETEKILVGHKPMEKQYGPAVADILIKDTRTIGRDKIRQSTLPSVPLLREISPSRFPIN